MALMLAFLALLIGAAACVLAWRARRASLRLALEMVELRDRLAEAERGRLAAEEAGALRTSTEAARDHTLAPRLDSLERRVRRIVSAPPTPAATPKPAFDPRAHVRRQLTRRGYERVSILGVGEDGRLRVEVERAGVVSKGCVEVSEDGDVHLRSVTSLRAFP